MKRWLSSILLCGLVVTFVFSASRSSALLSTQTFTPSPPPVSSCSALNSIRPARFVGYGALDGSVHFTISNNGAEVVYVTGFELVWPDPTHPEINQSSGLYYLRQVVQGNSASDPGGTILWTSVGAGHDATGNTKTVIPHDIATDSTNQLEGTWQFNGILYPGENEIWLDFDGFEGSIRQLEVLRHHFNGSRFFLSVGQSCDDITTTPTPEVNYTATDIPTYGPSQTRSPTPTNTLPFDPTLTTFTPTPSRTPTLTPTITPSRTPSLTRTASRTPTETSTPTIILSPTYTPSNISTDGPSPTPIFTPSPTLTFTPSVTLDSCGFLPTRTPLGGLTPTGGAGGDSIGIRTTPCPATYTPTFMITPSPTPSSTLTFTPSITLDPCGFHPTRTPIPTSTARDGMGGDSVGVRTTPCPATYTPTFTPSQTPTETPTLTPSVTDLPSLTPEPAVTNEPRLPMQLLMNPGMDNPVPNPIGWQVNHKPTSRKDDRMRYDADLGVFMFKGGRGEKSKIKQTLRLELLPLQTGDQLSLTMSYRKAGPQPNLRAKIDIEYRDGTSRSTQVVNLTKMVNRYRSASHSIQLKSPAVNTVVVSILHRSPSKKTKVFIDRVELWWIPSP